MEGSESLEYQLVPPQDQSISPLSDEYGVDAGGESGEGHGEDSKGSGGASGDPKYGDGDGEGTVGESGRDNACGDRATSSAPLLGTGAGDNSSRSTMTTNSTKSNTEVSAMQNLNNLAKNSREFQNGCDLWFSQKMVIQRKMVIPSLSMKVLKLRKCVSDDPFSLSVNHNGCDEYCFPMTMNPNGSDDSL